MRAVPVHRRALPEPPTREWARAEREWARAEREWARAEREWARAEREWARAERAERAERARARAVWARVARARAERVQAELLVAAVKAACRRAHPVRRRPETVVRAWATLALGETIRPYRAGLTLSAMALDIGSSRLLKRSVQSFLPTAPRRRTQRVWVKRPASMVRGRTQAPSALAPRQASLRPARYPPSFLAQAARRSCRTRAPLARFQPDPCAARFLV